LASDNRNIRAFSSPCAVAAIDSLVPRARVCGRICRQERMARFSFHLAAARSDSGKPSSLLLGNPGPQSSPLVPSSLRSRLERRHSSWVTCLFLSTARRPLTLALASQRHPGAKSRQRHADCGPIAFRPGACQWIAHLSRIGNKGSNKAKGDRIFTVQQTARKGGRIVIALACVPPCHAPMQKELFVPP